MAIAHEKNFVTGVLYIALGALIAGGASRYELGTAAQMGPGYFPFGLGIALALSGACVVIGSLGPRAGETKIGRWPLRNLGIVTLAVILFGLTLEPLGLIGAIPLLLGVAMLANPVFSWRALAGSIVSLTFFIWLVFVKLLGLQIAPLPSIFAS